MAGAGRETVLVVEDDEALRALVAETLERAGFSAFSAEDGEAGLREAERQRPAAAVVDVRLPGISGWEVCRALRDLHGDAIAIVFVSGERVDALDRVAGLLLGGDDYLVKPFAPDELVARVRSCVRRTGGAEAESPLTRRELEVLRMLADGRRQVQIAADLVISPKTVGSHIERILGKLGVSSRAQAVALAYRDGLVAP